MQRFSPRQYLKIDVANSYGLDKKDWQGRLAWFDANQHALLSKLGEAENPAMFYAGVKAWEDVKAGRASGYPISLDATASGMQILSVLTGDRKAAELTNVVDTRHRVDAYQALYNSMLKRVGGNSVQFSRSDLKRSIMTAFYGSEAVPKEIFGEGRMLSIFFETLEQDTPYIWELNRAFLQMWNPRALEYSWVLPDNFHVHVKVTDTVQEDVVFMGENFATYRRENRPVPTGRSIGANITHSIDGLIVREMLRRCSCTPELRQRVQNLICEGPGAVRSKETDDDRIVAELWDHYRCSGFLSARILEHLDPGNIGLVDTDPLQDMLETLPSKPFRIVPVHDCFRCHPNYGDDLRRQYNLQLHLIAKSGMLGFLLSQLLGRQIPVNKQEDFSEAILDADYALS